MQIKQTSEDYEAARLSKMTLEAEALQAPRAVLADVMFSLLEFKPLQQHLRWVYEADLLSFIPPSNWQIGKSPYIAISSASKFCALHVMAKGPSSPGQ